MQKYLCPNHGSSLHGHFLEFLNEMCDAYGDVTRYLQCLCRFLINSLMIPDTSCMQSVSHSFYPTYKVFINIYKHIQLLFHVKGQSQSPVVTEGNEWASCDHAQLLLPAVANTG